MDVSIILVNYNTKELTINCIKSIKEHTSGITYEIIVVDNASTDGSKEYFQKQNNITYIYQNKNLGFGKANNIGYKSASGKYIFLLNTDTLLKNNAIKYLFDFMENAPSNIGCAGCLLQDKDGNQIHSYGNFHTISNSIYQWIFFPILQKTRIVKKLKKYDDPSKYHPTPFKVDYITGADLFIRQSLINKCGLFDPDFFMYYEESYMQKKYTNFGYTSYIIHDPQIIHLEGASYTGKSLKKRIMVLEGLFTYMKKDLPQYKFLIFSFIFKFAYTFFFLFTNHKYSSKITHIKSILSL